MRRRVGRPLVESQHARSSSDPSVRAATGQHEAPSKRGNGGADHDGRGSGWMLCHGRAGFAHPADGLAVNDTWKTDPACLPSNLASRPSDELVRARMHFEDLEIFVGQRSRMHPGPGWATVLAMLAAGREAIEAELTRRGVRINVSPLR